MLVFFVLAFLLAGCAPDGMPPAPAVERPAGSLPETAAGAACAVTPDGGLVVVWEGEAESGRRIRSSRREPGPEGAWSSPARVDHPPGGAARALEPRVAAGPGGLVHAAWQDSRNGSFDIFVNRSTDGGRTWLEADRRIDGDEPGAAISSLASLAGDGTGNVFLAWEDLRHGQRDIYFARSTDSGVSWLRETRVDTDGPGAGISYHPQVVCWDGGTVIVCWWDERDGLADVYVRRSTDAGASWRGPERRVDAGAPGETASHDVRVVAGPGEVRLVWTEGHDRTGERREVVSVDRGGRWSRPEVLPPERALWRGARGLREWRIRAVGGRCDAVPRRDGRDGAPLPVPDLSDPAVRSIFGAVRDDGAAYVGWIRAREAGSALEVVLLEPAG